MQGFFLYRGNFNYGFKKFCSGDRGPGSGGEFNWNVYFENVCSKSNSPRNFFLWFIKVEAPVFRCVHCLAAALDESGCAEIAGFSGMKYSSNVNVCSLRFAASVKARSRFVTAPVNLLIFAVRREDETRRSRLGVARRRCGRMQCLPPV